MVGDGARRCTYYIYGSGLGLAAAWTEVALLESMPDHGLDCCAVSVAAAMSACERAFRWLAALDLMKAAAEAIPALFRKQVGYGRLQLVFCNVRSEWQQALSLLNEMQIAKVALNTRTVNEVMASFAKVAKWQWASLILGILQVPNLISQKMASTVHERAGRSQPRPGAELLREEHLFRSQARRNAPRQRVTSQPSCAEDFAEDISGDVMKIYEVCDMLNFSFC
eukprot:s164_g57.t1